MAVSSIPTLFIVCLAVVSSWAKIIDLSHKHGPDTFMASGMARYNRTLVFKGIMFPGVYVEMADITSGEHGGTHMDAPSHFIKDSTTLDNIPLENLILNGVMIDCSKDVNGNANYVLPLQKLKDWEQEHGMISQGAGIIINFGWSSRFSNHAEYVHTNNLADFTTFKYPTISTEAATWMIQDRGIKLVAVDTPGPDLGEFPVHRTLLGAGSTIVENVRDPGRLPAKGFRLHAVPVAFQGVTGTQIRFYAITHDDDYFRGNSGQPFSVVSILTITASCVFSISFVQRIQFD